MTKKKKESCSNRKLRFLQETSETKWKCVIEYKRRRETLRLRKKTGSAQLKGSRQPWTQKISVMKATEQKLILIARILSKKLEKKNFSIKMLPLLKKKSATRVTISKLKKMSLKNFKIKFKAIKLTHKSYKKWSFNWKKIRTSMAWRLLMLMQDIINALNRWNLKTI